MPELPEVETIRRGLETLIIGKVIAHVDHDYPKGFPNDPEQVKQFVIGAGVAAVRRRAKVLMIDLSTEYTLVIHLKMTGQMVYRGEQVFGAGHPNASLIGELPDRSTRVTITFNDEAKLHFNDQRKFGWMKLYPTVEVPNIDFMKKVGPEPLEGDLTANDFILRMRRRNRTSVKAAILDQTVIAGVGNIYADESLWAARIHPATRVELVTDEELTVLLGEIQKVLTFSIEQGGSSDRNYVDAAGNKGAYLDFANVFRKEGSPCPRCGTIIEKSRVAGRGTHTCPYCQVMRETA